MFIDRVTSFFLDECKKQFNANSVLKLNALSQFHEPPGFTVFDTGMLKIILYIIHIMFGNKNYYF